MARRRKKRRLSIRQWAILWAAVASLLATCVPPFVRELRTSPLHEVEEALPRLGALVLEHYARTGTLPESVALTPPTPTRGVPRIDPPGTWEHPTWLALGFRPVAESAPHMFSFAFENQGQSFEIEARGDLDGDGATSRFALRGRIDNGVAKLDEGMIVENELE